MGWAGGGARQRTAHAQPPPPACPLPACPFVTCRGSRPTAASRWRRAAQRGGGGGAAVVEALLFPPPPRALSAAPLPIKVTMATGAPAALGAAPRCGGGRPRPASLGPSAAGRALGGHRRAAPTSAGPVPIAGLPRRGLAWPGLAWPPRLGAEPRPGWAPVVPRRGGGGLPPPGGGAGGRGRLSAPAGRDRLPRSLWQRPEEAEGSLRAALACSLAWWIPLPPLPGVLC